MRPWAFGAATAAWLFTAGWVRWKNRAAIVELCRTFGYSYDIREPVELPSIGIDSLVPPGALLDIREIDAVEGNVNDRELVTICRLVRHASPEAVFEFGTFDGRTTLNLAANAPGAHVHTIDLPQGTLNSSAAPLHAHETRYADKPVSGARFLSSELAAGITQLHGDSGAFDLSPFYDSIDFIFVDGSHTYEYVINDSLHAMKMLRGGHGTIVWHDYGRWDGVTRALNQLRRLDPAFSGISHVSGTTLAHLRR